MTSIHHKKVHHKNIIGAVVAGIAGAVAGAVAVGATIALKDEDSRKKTKKVLIDLKDQAMDYIDTLKADTDIEEKTDSVKKIATNTKKVIKKKVN